MYENKKMPISQNRTNLCLFVGFACFSFVFYFITFTHEFFINDDYRFTSFWADQCKVLPFYNFSWVLGRPLAYIFNCVTLWTVPDINLFRFARIYNLLFIVLAAGGMFALFRAARVRIGIAVGICLVIMTLPGFLYLVSLIGATHLIFAYTAVVWATFLVFWSVMSEKLNKLHLFVNLALFILLGTLSMFAYQAALPLALACIWILFFHLEAKNKKIQCALFLATGLLIFGAYFAWYVLSGNYAKMANMGFYGKVSQTPWTNLVLFVTDTLPRAMYPSIFDPNEFNPMIVYLALLLLIFVTHKNYLLKQPKKALKTFFLKICIFVSGAIIAFGPSLFSQIGFRYRVIVPVTLFTFVYFVLNWSNNKTTRSNWFNILFSLGVFWILVVNFHTLKRGIVDPQVTELRLLQTDFKNHFLQQQCLSSVEFEATNIANSRIFGEEFYQSGVDFIDSFKSDITGLVTKSLNIPVPAIGAIKFVPRDSPISNDQCVLRIDVGKVQYSIWGHERM